MDVDVKQDVIDILNESLPYWILFATPFDGSQEILECYLKGIELRQYVSFFAFICFYFISLPLSYYLTLVDNWGLKGIWIGYGSCVAVLTVILLARLVFIRFDYRGKVIRDRIEKEH